MSKLHAEIYEDGGALRLRDLHSTNGTFVDHERIDDVVLRDGHVLHFSESEWRLGFDRELTRRTRTGETLIVNGLVLPETFAKGTDQLRELMAERRIGTLYQPIVAIPGGRVVAYEALARGCQPGLPKSPAELFRIAEAIRAEAELSRLCRRMAVEHLAGARGSLTLFLNSHPSEFNQPGLVESLTELRELAPRLSLVLEIHEGMLADPAGMIALQCELKRIGVGLAYDDFGAGQARLLELAEVPPDYLKFDRRFVEAIHLAPDSRRRLLSSLIAAARDLQARCIGEGIETPEEAAVCEEIGFTHAQGYHYSRPITLPAVPAS